MCWGGCVDPKECASVKSCKVCDAAYNEFCVENVAEPTTKHCVYNKNDCSIDCGCLGADVCVGMFHQCQDGVSTTDNLLRCTCPEC
jgi:hypothetical protein